MRLLPLGKLARSLIVASVALAIGDTSALPAAGTALAPSDLAAVVVESAHSSFPMDSRDIWMDTHSNATTYTPHRYPEKRPAGGAYAKNIPMPGGSADLFTWHSVTPVEASAETAVIIIHGRLRDANTYFDTLDLAWSMARASDIGSAKENTIRVAPLFFSTVRDNGTYANTHLAWGDINAWTAGSGSTHPTHSSFSSFAVLDVLLSHFSDIQTFPAMQKVIFVAHGGGAQMLQRYSVLGNDSPNPDRISVSYCIGDPSTLLYFTRDRPVAVSEADCPSFDSFRYGLSDFREPYPLPLEGDAAGMYKRYAARDVRYIVGLDDTSHELGDQSCEGRAAGGDQRKNRSLAYWKYLQLLGGTSPDILSLFPGTFPLLESLVAGTVADVTSGLGLGNATTGLRLAASVADATSPIQAAAGIGNSLTWTSTIPVSNATYAARFSGTNVTHHLATVNGATHDARVVLTSDVGLQVVFADRHSLAAQAVTKVPKSEALTM